MHKSPLKGEEVPFPLPRWDGVGEASHHDLKDVAIIVFYGIGQGVHYQQVNGSVKDSFTEP